MFGLYNTYLCYDVITYRIEPRYIGLFSINSTNSTYILTTPSMAIYSSFLGRQMANIRSMYSKIATIISSSFFGAGLKQNSIFHVYRYFQWYIHNVVWTQFAMHVIKNKSDNMGVFGFKVQSSNPNSVRTNNN